MMSVSALSDAFSTQAQNSKQGSKGVEEPITNFMDILLEVGTSLSQAKQGAQKAIDRKITQENQARGQNTKEEPTRRSENNIKDGPKPRPIKKDEVTRNEVKEIDTPCEVLEENEECYIHLSKDDPEESLNVSSVVVLAQSTRDEKNILVWDEKSEEERSLNLIDYEGSDAGRKSGEEDKILKPDIMMESDAPERLKISEFLGEEIEIPFQEMILSDLKKPTEEQRIRTAQDTSILSPEEQDSQLSIVSLQEQTQSELGAREEESSLSKQFMGAFSPSDHSVNTKESFMQKLLGGVESKPSVNIMNAPKSFSPISTKIGAQPYVPFLNQVLEGMKSAIKSDTKTISLELRPDHLGKLEITLELDKNQYVSAMITVEKPETLDLLKRDSDALQKLLGDSGLKADSNSLNFNLQGGFAGEEKKSSPSSLPSSHSLADGEKEGELKVTRHHYADPTKQLDQRV